MQSTVEGRVWKFGDNIDTDIICPGSYMHLPAKDILPFAFKAVRPGFYSAVQEGDVIVAGKNFGIGSSRECAAAVLKEMGIGACVVDSVGRIFFRNCIALGIPVIVHKNISKHFNEGDHIKIDLETGKVTNTSMGIELEVSPLPQSLIQIVRSGGLRPLIRKILEKY
ncbi:3-isopropylmalate dehydratase small subunit [Archaeoglobales archaeon]|nr:MAG: 3-isopropylmalate dehydratase small subunit [Archaeoglobales archaeon]